MNSHHWIPNQFFGSKIFCSNEFAEFEKNLQKIFAFFFESNETTLFSSNDILDCFPYLEGIPRDLPRDIPRVLIFYIFFLKVFIYNFFTRKFDILKIIFIKFFIVLGIRSFQDAFNPFCTCGYEVGSCHYFLQRSNRVTEMEILYKIITNANDIILNGDHITFIKTLIFKYTDKMVKPF